MACHLCVVACHQVLSEPPDALASKGRKVPVAIGELKIFPLKQENFIRVYEWAAMGA